MNRQTHSLVTQITQLLWMSTSAHHGDTS